MSIDPLDPDPLFPHTHLPVMTKDYYDKLDEYEGMSNHDLLAQTEVQQLFYRYSHFYPRDCPEDLAQQAFVMFLGVAPVKPRGKFSKYICQIAKHAVLKAFLFRILAQKGNLGKWPTFRVLSPKAESHVLAYHHVDQHLAHNFFACHHAMLI